MNDLALSLGQRSVLWSLQELTSLSAQTEERLTTGRKINSVKDDAVKYFMSKGLSDRSGDQLTYKDDIDQAISSLTAAIDGLDSIETVLKQMKGIVESTKDQSQTEREASTLQFQVLGTQLSHLTSDASYRGLNLLEQTQNTLDVYFSDRTASRLKIQGFNLNATTAGNSRQLFTTAAFLSDGEMASFSTVLGSQAIFTDSNGNQIIAAGFTAIGSDNKYLTLATRVTSILDDAIYRIRADAAEYATSVSLLTIRSDFAQTYSDELAGGSDKLTLADMNEEGANMTAIQTRYQVGMSTLKFSGDMTRNILTLIQ